MQLVTDSFVSLILLGPLIVIYVLGYRNSPYGAVSLPCIMILTGVIYFYLMPVVVLASGDEGLYGMFIGSLESTHIAVCLYAAGAAVALIANWRAFTVDPAPSRLADTPISQHMLAIAWALALGITVIQIASGKLNLAGSENYQFAGGEAMGELAFLTQGYNMMIPLMLVTLVWERFSARSLVLLAVVIVVFLQIGFRFRIMLLLASVVTAYMLVQGKRLSFLQMSLGLVVAVGLSNLIGSMRRYGQGLVLENLNETKVDSVLTSFGGEFGIVYVFNYVTEHTLPNAVTFEPWIVAVTRLVPSVLWPNKPYPEYLKLAAAGATMQGADQAGIGAPQHVEMLFQFGWVGLPVLACLYYGVIGLLMVQFLKLGREARIAGCSLVPAFFGYYMQTRGYFSQTFSDGLFMFGPLFLLHQKRVVMSGRSFPAKTVQRTTQERPQL